MILTIVSIDANEVCSQACKACVEQVIDVFMVLELTLTVNNSFLFDI